MADAPKSKLATPEEAEAIRDARAEIDRRQADHEKAVKALVADAVKAEMAGMRDDLRKQIADAFSMVRGVGRKRDGAEETEEEEERDDPMAREGDPEELAADTRADSATLLQRLTRQVEDLRRERQRSDEDVDALSELQTDWQRVALSHGDKVSQPMIGESPASYDRRNARRYQRYSARWKDVDLRDAPADVLRVACPEVRKDALSAAYTIAPTDAPLLLREVKRKVGPREISEFVGPFRAVNGFGQFCLPKMRAKINPPNGGGSYLG